jgi:hypothetical protein
MPEISRFYGIIIRMYCEPGSRHHAPHFHAYYQNHSAVISLVSIELIEGSLPPRQRRLVLAWSEIHFRELMMDWEVLQRGEKPFSIEPLQ